MNSRISRNIRIILRSERLIARRHMAILQRQTGLFLSAGLLGGIGLVMLNAAAYLALAEQMSPAAAAMIVAVVNIILAGVLAFWAGTLSAESDIAPVCEVRDMAVADLEGELEDATAEIRDVALSVKKIARDPLGVAGANVLGSLLALLLKNLRS